MVAGLNLKSSSLSFTFSLSYSAGVGTLVPWFNLRSLSFQTPAAEPSRKQLTKSKSPPFRLSLKGHRLSLKGHRLSLKGHRLSFKGHRLSLKGHRLALQGCIQLRKGKKKPQFKHEMGLYNRFRSYTNIIIGFSNMPLNVCKKAAPLAPSTTR